jgi:hypothetical protein
MSLPFVIKGNVRLLHNTFSLDNNGNQLKQSFETFYYVQPYETIDVNDSFIYVRAPCYGQISSNRFDIMFDYDYDVTLFASQIEMNIHEIKITNTVPPTKHLHAEHIEPASWFIDITPIYSQRKGMSTSTYVEFVLSPKEIREHRLFSDKWKNTMPLQISPNGK